MTLDLRSGIISRSTLATLTYSNYMRIDYPDPLIFFMLWLVVILVPISCEECSERSSSSVQLSCSSPDYDLSCAILFNFPVPVVILRLGCTFLLRDWLV